MPRDTDALKVNTAIRESQSWQLIETGSGYILTFNREMHRKGPLLDER